MTEQAKRTTVQNEVVINDIEPSPVLKWAGGKTQLLPVLNKYYPTDLIKGNIETYIEPFFGGGAVYFDIYKKYQIKKAVLFDINPELVILYTTLKETASSLIEELRALEKHYLELKSEESRKDLFYKVRNTYNSGVEQAHSFLDTPQSNAKRSAMTIFLNRTCFNGLFRVNSKGHFNVPHGRYKNPTILFENKLTATSLALKNTVIMKADFSRTKEFVSGKTFVYYDPPYRPVSKTSTFTSYSKDAFNDDEQTRLASLIKELNEKDVYQLLSNSDPTNYVEDPFFDNLYKGFNIRRVDATRRINANACKRGNLREILVSNYKDE